MTKYTVLFQQYVEQTAAVEVEAADSDEAVSLAYSTDPGVTAEWDEGDDGSKAEAYAIIDEHGEEWSLR